MDTKKVQELLKTIEGAETKLKELEKSLAEHQERVKGQAQLVLDLKRELAEQLRDVLPPAKGRRAAGAEPESARATGLSDAIVAALADGKPRATRDIAEAVKAKGLNAANVGLAMSYLAKKGRVRRVSRGTYAKA